MERTRRAGEGLQSLWFHQAPRRRAGAGLQTALGTGGAKEYLLSPDAKRRGEGAGGGGGVLKAS